MNRQIVRLAKIARRFGRRGGFKVVKSGSDIILKRPGTDGNRDRGVILISCDSRQIYFCDSGDKQTVGELLKRINKSVFKAGFLIEYTSKLI